MREALHKHHISFKNAFAGLTWALSTQPNFRVHLVLSALALLCGFLFKVSFVEMVLLVFTILLGLSAELINTALEAMTDLITHEWRAEAKIAKDVSAGMMLLVSMGAIFIACLIFLPHIFNLL